MKSAASRLADEAGRLAAEMRAVPPELIERCRPELERIDRRIRPGTLRNVGPTIAKLADMDLPPEESPRETRRPAAGGHRRFSPRQRPRSRRRRQRGLDRAAGRRGPLALDVGRIGGDVGRAVLAAAGQFAVRDRRLGLGLFVHQLHAVVGLGAGGDRRVGPAPRRAPRRLRREDRRDAAEERAGADVRPAEPRK